MPVPPSGSTLTPQVTLAADGIALQSQPAGHCAVAVHVVTIGSQWFVVAGVQPQSGGMVVPVGAGVGAGSGAGAPVPGGAGVGGGTGSMPPLPALPLVPLPELPLPALPLQKQLG